MIKTHGMQTHSDRQQNDGGGWRRINRIAIAFILSVSVFNGFSLPYPGNTRSQTDTRVFAQSTKSSPTITQTMRNLKQSNQRWIEIRLKQQRLIAWEGNQPIYGVRVSTGKPSTPTPTGVFAVQTKLRVTRMRGTGYDIPDVPYTMYYHHGYAIHGAYWHNRFGTPVSHGCINLRPQQARWLFSWAKVGTPIVVRE
ncbi:L,D-transpeptidase [Calothrix sp. NIES-3974]|uniref:L,D-transpeptidase n=1 Tax=Calothrix sp. NIES-3974 TaxID=2005462 RepID=UPI001E48AB7A|nr:L,D-transpeptidase [Calothrix sp. NIES-3974]